MKILFVPLLVMAGLIPTMSATARADSCRFRDSQDFEDVPGIGTIKGAYTVADCEMVAGLRVAKDAFIQWYKNGQLLGFQLSTDTLVESRFPVKAGARVYWHDNGRLSALNQFTQDTEIAPGVWTRQRSPRGFWSSTVNWDRDGHVSWIEVLAKPIRDASGNELASRCQAASFRPDGQVVAGMRYDCSN